MHLRVAAGAALLGILAAFVTWSVAWTLADRAVITYGVLGDVTVLSTYRNGSDVALHEGEEARDELVSLLERENVPMVIASSGDGLPRIAVLDPRNRVPWAAPISAVHDVRQGEVWVVRDSYTSLQRGDGASSPFIAPDQVVAGEVEPPPGGTNFQVATSIVTTPIFSGNVVLGSTEQHVVEEVSVVLAHAGFEVQAVSSVPLASDLVNQPFVVTTMLFYSAGLASAGAAWHFALTTRAPELTIRRWFGATVPVLTLRWTVREVPGIAVGTCLGMAMSALAVSVVGGDAVAVDEWAILLLGAVAASLVAIGVVAVVTALAISGHSGAQRVR